MPAHARPLCDLVTIDQLIAAYFVFVAGQVEAGVNKPATVEYYRGQLAAWRATLPSDLPLDQLRAYHLIGRGGIKRPRIQAVQRLFNWARSQDLVDGSPFDNVKMPSLGQRKRILSSLELAILIRASSRPLRWLLVFGLHTIGRPGEIRGAQWCHYDSVKQQFILEEFKADRRRADQGALRVIPVDAFLARVLARWRARRSPRPQDPIFRNSKGEAWTKNAIVQAVDTARRRAWIVTVKGVGEQRLLGVVARDEDAAIAKARAAGCEPLSARSLYDGRESVVCYHLRHTRATRAIENGANLVQLSIVMGHADTRMTQRYLHPDREALGHVVDLAGGKRKSAAS